MSEIEKAIEYFEDAVRESDEIIADCSEALQAELTEQKQHSVVALEVMRRTVPGNKPLTHFDRITKKPESLAKLIFSVIKNSEVCQCPAFTYCNGTGGINCEQTLIKWLNKPEQEEK